MSSRSRLQGILRHFVSCAVVLLLFCATAQGEGNTESRKALSVVYGAYQSVLSNKEACDEALPGQKAANGKAFSSWQARHKKLIAELDQQFTALIRNASADDRDYARNVGKSEGAILRQRQEVKDTLLAKPRTEIEKVCKGLPRFLASPDSDLEKSFVEELRVIRRADPVK
jgi:hypothetical protein